MAPTATAKILALVLVNGVCMGYPFRVRRSFSTNTRRTVAAKPQKTCPLSYCPEHTGKERVSSTCGTTVTPPSVLATHGNGDADSIHGSTGGGETVPELRPMPAMAEATGPSGAEGDALNHDEEAARLHREVFANESGFLQSEAFNPTRAREKTEQEEAARMAVEWGTSREKAREIIDAMKERNLSFQELENIARELQMSDGQQRAFVMKASMRKLAEATTLPGRRPSEAHNPVKEAVRERVFASEKGFLKNSEDFKRRMKAGSGVQFDAEGFPVLDEGDPVIEVARTSKNKTRSGVGEVQFAVLPDCPRCAIPTVEEELSRFGMCSQCKADEILATEFFRPSAPSKYTYDNGEAPFSSSWGADGGTSGGRMTVDAPSDKSQRDSERLPESRKRKLPGSPTATRGSPSTMDVRSRQTYEGAASASSAERASTQARVSSRDVAVAAAAPKTALKAGTRRDAGVPGVATDTSDEAVRALARELADVRTQLTKMLTGDRARGTRVSATAADNTKDAERDRALRRLFREISDLRRALDVVADQTRVKADLSPGPLEGAASRRLALEVAELRSQLEQNRKDQALTQAALRRLQEKVDGLEARSARR